MKCAPFVLPAPLPTIGKNFEPKQMKQVSPRNEPGQEMTVELLGYSVDESDIESYTFLSRKRVAVVSYTYRTESCHSVFKLFG